MASSEDMAKLDDLVSSGKIVQWESAPMTKWEECDLCGSVGQRAVVDGVTIRGGWAYMCRRCFEREGVGLGVGKGQALIYSEPDDGELDEDDVEADRAFVRRLRMDFRKKLKSLGKEPDVIAAALEIWDEEAESLLAAMELDDFDSDEFNAAMNRIRGVESEETAK